MPSPAYEVYLSSRDPVLAAGHFLRHLTFGPTNRIPIPFGVSSGSLSRRQISTKAALTISGRLAALYPTLPSGPPFQSVTFEGLRSCGLSPRKAACCEQVLSLVPSFNPGDDWCAAFRKVHGIGSWTLDMFRIFVLRDLDVLPRGDLGLERAFRDNYPKGSNIVAISENWRPFRSVASWHLWRSLGNTPLG